MWALNWQGRQVRGDDLTLGEVEEVERLAGSPWARVMPWNSARHARACATVAAARLGVADVSMARMSDFVKADDDLAKLWQDGVPTSGGRGADRWIAQLCLPPFSFTPRQVRDEFTVRDIEVILMARRSAS